MNQNEALKIIINHNLEQVKLEILEKDLSLLKNEIASQKKQIKNNSTSYKNAKVCLRNCTKYVQNFEKKYPHLKYLSGYKTIAKTDKSSRYFKIWVQDKKTKIRFWVGSSDVRKPTYTGNVLLTHKSHILKEDLEIYDQIIRDNNKKSKCILFYPCRTCGRVFESKWGKQFCSDSCKRKWNNRLREKRKSERTRKAKQNGKYDSTITLEKIYKRDKGRCYICGKKLKINTFYNDPFAPTIEHVIPIIKGGTHSWDNVKLSCRSCNNLKGTKSIESILKAY